MNGPCDGRMNRALLRRRPAALQPGALLFPRHASSGRRARTSRGHCFRRPIFGAFRLGVSSALWAGQSCWVLVFLRPLGGSRRFITHHISTPRAPAVETLPFTPISNEEALQIPDPADPAGKSVTVTVTQIRDKGEAGRRGAAHMPGTLLRLTSWLFQGCDGTFSDL